MKDKLSEGYYGFDKRDVKETSPVLIWEVWENFTPDKSINGDKKKYFSDILSTEQLKTMIPFWKRVGTELQDPVFSFQLDRNGGATILYNYTDGRDGAPPNARYPIIKPIFEKGILKLVLADATRSTLIFHASINSPSFEDDIKYFASIIEKFAFTEDMPNEKDVQYIDMFSNVFVFDRRINKSTKNN